MEPQNVLKIDNNYTLKASNFKIFLGECPQTPLGACDYRTSVLMSTPNNFYPHTPMAFTNWVNSSVTDLVVSFPSLSWLCHSSSTSWLSSGCCKKSSDLFSFAGHYSCSWKGIAGVKFTACFCTYTPAGWVRPLVCPFLGLCDFLGIWDVSTKRRARYCYMHWLWALWQPGMWWLRYVHNYPVMATDLWVGW